MKNKVVKIALSTTLTILFSACGGESGSTSNSSSSVSQTLHGIVSDPMIQNSLIKVCTSNLATCLEYSDKTDEDGAFTIANIPNSINLSSYTLVAVGGIDTQTEESFDGISFTIPLGDVATLNGFVVSPLTTLMQANGWTKEETAQKLGITVEQLLSNPMQSALLQKKALLVAQIAKKRSGDFSFSSDTNLSTLTSLIPTLFVDEQEQKELLAFETLLSDGNTTNEIVSRFNGLKTVFSSSLYKDANTTDDMAFTNAKNWTLAVLEHLKDNNITQMNIAQIQAVFANSDFNDANLSKDTNLSINTTEVNLADILPLNALYDSALPLSATLGFDSDTRRTYYYSSTASNLYKAEVLTKGLNDISITDDIYIDLAKAYLQNNEINRALAYANSKIFLKENKADVLRLVGEAVLNSNAAQAEELFDEAFVLYKEVTEAKGAGNMKNVDIFDYRYLLKDYSELGLTAKAVAVTDYITSKTAEFTTTTQYGSYLVGMSQAAEELINNGQIAEAVAILDDAWDLAQNTPANNADTKAESGQYYKSRVYYALAIAELYAMAGPAYYHKAEMIADAMQALRLNDGNSANGVFGASTDTGAQTNAYVASSAGLGANLVSIYVQIGKLEKALGVIPTATSSSYEQYGYAVYALGLATTSDDMNDSFAVIDNNITSYKDQLKALTYNGINKGGAFISQYMIEHGESVKAKEAIDKAIEILDAAVVANSETTDANKDIYYVQYGYAKLANLYAMIGEDSLATTYFNKAIAIATGTDSNSLINITTPAEQLDSLFRIVDNLDEVDRTTEVLTQINNAFSIISSLTTEKEKLAEYGELLFYHASDSASYTLKRTYAFQESVADAMKAIIDASNGNIGESSSDANYKKIVDYLIEMAHTYASLGDLVKTQTVLSSAREYAVLIAKASDKVSKLQAIVEAYGAHGYISEASNVAELIEYASDKREAIALIASSIYLNDAFPTCSIASVDSDSDGKPDFFSQGATTEEINNCQLVLDDDIDGDGLDENSDLRPYFVD